MLATILGFVVGIARLSKNWLLAKLAAGYVEIIRNLPLLLQLLFWYNAVLKALPDLRDSWTLPGGIFLNNRGLVPAAADLRSRACSSSSVALARRRSSARSRYRVWAQQAAGAHRPAGAGRAWSRSALIIGLPLVAFCRSPACRSTLDYPEKGRFNIRGGIEILPEFVALLFGL